MKIPSKIEYQNWNGKTYMLREAEGLSALDVLIFKINEIIEYLDSQTNTEKEEKAK